MQRLCGSPLIIIVLLYFLCLWTCVTSLCPKQCECSDVSLTVSCDSANLDLVPITLNPELRQFNLSNNHITSIRSSFRFYSYLEYLDLSSNNLTALNKDNFANLRYLKELYLNNNNIYALQTDTFINLSSLEKLYLNGNSLVNLTSEIFKQLSNLKILELSQNQISFIDEKALFWLKNLKTLILRGNNLFAIPSASFQYIPELHELDLGLNSFENIPENSFAFLTELIVLSLNSCGIQVISQGAFKWLNHLQVLHIHDNELSEIPTKAFFDIMNLQELHIGKNKFKDIKAKSFQRLKFLHTIVINNSPYLEFIGKGVFTDNINLKKLIVNQNKVLKYIEDGAFDNLPNIKHVSLRANAFETFQENLLPWNELYSLDVRDNPLVCNCSLLWLWRLLVTKNFSSAEDLSDTTQVVCVNPPESKDTILPNLLETDLDCYAMDTRRQIVIGIVLVGAIISAAIIMVGFRYRDKVAGVLKTKWGHGRKEPQYQKTSAEEENTILQTAHQSLKMTPVTEL